MNRINLVSQLNYSKLNSSLLRLISEIHFFLWFLNFTIILLSRLNESELTLEIKVVIVLEEYLISILKYKFTTFPNKKIKS